MNILSLKHAQVAFLASAQPQRWARYAPPAGTRTLHDFGEGPEPAVPVDERVVTNEIVKCVDNNFPMDTAAVTNEIVNTVDNNFPMDSPSVTNEIVSAINNNFPLDIASVGGEFANIVENTSPRDETGVGGVWTGVVENTSPRDDVSTTQVIVNCLENPPVTYTALNYAYLRSVSAPSSQTPYAITLPTPISSLSRIDVCNLSHTYTGSSTDSRIAVQWWTSFGDNSYPKVGLYTNGKITDDPQHNAELQLVPHNNGSSVPSVVTDAVWPNKYYTAKISGYEWWMSNGDNIWSGRFNDDTVSEITLTKLFVFGSAAWTGNVYGGDYYLHNKCFVYARAWDGETLLVDIVPALRHNDDKIGLWDRVSQTFWPFMDGNFVASDLSPDQGEL